MDSMALICSAGLLSCSEEKATLDNEIDSEIESDESNTGQDSADPVEILSWDQFIAELEVLSAKQHEAMWDQEAHVEAVAELMLRLDPEAQAVVDVLDNYSNNNPNFPELIPIHEVVDFEVTVIQFEAGEIIDMHNHPDMSGVIHCISGDIDIEGFNLLDERSADGNLLVERIAQVRLQSGDITSLTAERGNIHALMANEFTELLDVFTPPYAGDRITRYRWYQRLDQPYEGRQNVFEAWED